MAGKGNFFIFLLGAFMMLFSIVLAYKEKISVDNGLSIYMIGMILVFLSALITLKKK